jgi:phage-related minor tail protein
MGFGINTATGFLASLEKSGIDTGTMLAGLKKALQNATKDGKPLNEALAEMQEKMAGAATETEAAQIATELFGAKAGPAIAKAVQEGRVSFDELSNTVQDWGDSVNATFDATLDASDQFSLAMQNVKVAVGSTVGEFLDEHAPQITAILQDLTDNVLPGATAALGALLDGFSWLIDNGEGIAAAVVGIAAGVGAYVAYQTALTVMSEGWTALTVVTKAQTIAQTALNAVMAANPIGIVIAAIAALVAAFVVLWNTNEDFRKKVIELWTALKENISKLIDGIKETVTNVWNNIKETVSGIVTAIKDTITKIWNNIKETVSGTVSAIKDTVTSTWEAVKTKVTDTVNGIKEKVSEAWNNVKESVSGAVENVKTKVADAWDNVKSKTTEIWESVKSKTSEAWKNVKSSITKPIEDAKEAVRKAVDSIRDKINNVKLEFPKIKLPHFTVTGGEAPWGLMGKGSMPKISVSWYARGGVFDSPTLLSGIGENGAEAVVPLEKNKEWIRKVAADMSAELRAELGAGGFTPAGAGRSSRTTFTQIINAPKQPSRLELYRQTRNLLALREATT